jgi:hypothetical protein
MIITLDSIDNIIGGGTYYIWSCNEHENLHFNNEKHIHMREDSYGLDLDMLSISH